MPTNATLPSYTDIAATAGTCPTGYFGLPLLGPYTDCRVNRGWHDYDFVWTKGGKVLVACCPTALNGNHGMLRVWLYDDAYPPNAVEPITIESEGVWGCTLIERPDGILDLWALKASLESQPHHYFSRDGGETWSAAEVHSAGIFDFDGSAGISTVPLLSGSQHCFHPLPAALLPGQNMLVMLMEGAYNAGGGSYYKGAYLLCARLKADGERWEFTGKKIVAGYNSSGVQSWTVGSKSFGSANMLQAMPDGSILVLPGYAHIKAIEDDATCTIESYQGGGTESFPTSQFTSTGVPYCGRGVRSGAVWRTGRRMTFVSASVAAGQPTYPLQKYWRWGQAEFSAASRWAGTAASVYPPGTGLDADYVLGIRAVNGDRRELDGYDAFDDSIPLCKHRADGRIEFLRVNHLAELEFARAKVMPDDNVTTWDGR